MLSNIKTFFYLPFSHKLIFMKFSLLVPLVELGVKTVKFKRTFNLLKFFTTQNKTSVENEKSIVRRHANFLYLYHKQFPFLGKCLARSLSLWFLLARKGIETDLKFGMKKEDGEFLAHAWIEFNGEPLVTKSELNENYVPFSDSILTKVAK